ncbi:hypothetical protein HPB52_001140 [Rhipicephalus sanguineus]|uniref:Uncharacterized protein n=1 Tax=Rhipicephalus sanguineus TaxID=34632 RepID=A0A9D4T323_RHISA|nr:hypothetical protein HPB52_001140 [Rhipicephalus sanguineus]
MCDDFSLVAPLMAGYVRDHRVQFYVLDIDHETNTYHLSTRESRIVLEVYFTRRLDGLANCIKQTTLREEQEKLNVWTALLNLEHMYGTRDSLNSVFKEAVQFNEPLKVYEHLAQIYAAGSEREVRAFCMLLSCLQYKQMLNKFKQHADVWLSFGLFYMKCGQTEDCRDLLRRALKSLPSWEHIVLMTKFAQIEFTYGDAARG